MALFGGLWDAALAIFLVLVFAEYIKVRAKASKQFNWIAAGGVFIVLAAATTALIGSFHASISLLSNLFSAIAWIAVLIGAIWGAAELLKAK